MKVLLLTASLALGSVAVAAVPVQAQAQYNVVLDTSPLVGHPDEPFSIDFQLIDGSGTGDDNNSITLSNFQFGGGGPSDVPDDFGDATGDLASTVTLDDGQPFNEFSQQFTAGNQFSFHVSTTTNVDPGGVFDEFDFSILDNTLQPIPTRDVTGNNALLRLTLDGPSPNVETYATNPTTPPNAGGPVIEMGPPLLVPEPSPCSLLGIGLAAVLARRWSRKRAG